MTTYRSALKMALKEYPDLFPTEEAYLYQLFFVSGNGYKWEKGQLVHVLSINERKKISDSHAKAIESFSKDLDLVYKNLKKVGLFLEQFTPPTSKPHIKIWRLSEYSKICSIPDDAKKDWLNACEKAIDYARTLKKTKSDSRWLEKALIKVMELKRK